MVCRVGMRRLLTMSAPVWWRRSGNLLDGVAPGFFADILNRRYALGGASVSLASVLTVTAASGKTYLDAGGVLRTAAANEARIDCSSGVAELLLEGAATNLALRSQEFDNASWSKSAATIAADAIASPDAAVTADKLQEDNTTASHIAQQFYSGFTSGTAYTFTVFVKAAERGFCWIFLPSAAFGVTQSAFFNLTAGTVGNVAGTPTATITALGNGYYRCGITATATATAGGNFGVGIASANGTSSYAGTTGSGIYVYGAQLEALGLATSYIPTTASAVTRATDLCQLTAAAAAILQGASAAVAWRGVLPVAITGQQVIGLGDGLNLIRATNTPNTRLAIFNATSGLALGVSANVIPGNLGCCAGWGASGTRFATNGTSGEAAQTNAWASTIYLGPSTGLASGQVFRIRQLVGWTMTDRPLLASVAAQSRVAP